jgi:hypothetical protein
VLAYVFWHRPAAGVDAALYEATLAAFQQALAAAPPPGFHRSAVFRVADAPWLSGEGYEDWYLVDGFAALGPLNEAAVSPELRASHDAAAELAAEGAAGIYRLRAGDAAAVPATASLWFGKPAGMGYDQLYELLDLWASNSGASLWGRQLVLGPTPEFCLRAEKPAVLPSSLAPVSTSVSPVWP